MPGPAVIEVQKAHKDFALGGEIIQTLRGVSFSIARGEMAAILGPSGSGRSTLLGLLGGLDTPASGTVRIDGVDISRMGERQLTRLCNEKIGFVFQFFNLIPTLTALENVALPMQFAPRPQPHPGKRAAELLADEPTGNLNQETGTLVMEAIRSLHQDLGTTVVLVTHDLRIAGQAGRRLTLVDGKIA